MKASLKVLLTLLCLSYVQYCSAQLSDEATISILTCRAGDDIYNMFGHTAVRIQDPIAGLDEVYNYGLFDFREPGFVMKFLRGKLKYWVGRAPYNRFVRNYKVEKRSIREQVLNLSPSEKKQLYTALRDNIKKENKYYKYDFFFDNCSTRVRDILENNVNLLTFSDEASPHTFRQLLDQFNFVCPWIDFGMDLLIGVPSDQSANDRDQMFLPEYLYKQLAQSSVGHEPLVVNTNLLLDHESQYASRQKASFFGPALIFGLLLLLELFFFFKGKHSSKLISIYDACFFTTLGIAGLILLFMWFGTDHITTKTNLNVLWMSPLFILVLFRKSHKVLLVLIAMIIIALVLGVFVQQLHIASIILALIALFKLLRLYKSSHLN